LEAPAKYAPAGKRITLVAALIEISRARRGLDDGTAPQAWLTPMEGLRAGLPSSGRA